MKADSDDLQLMCLTNITIALETSEEVKYDGIGLRGTNLIRVN